MAAVWYRILADWESPGNHSSYLFRYDHPNDVPFTIDWDLRTAINDWYITSYPSNIARITMALLRPQVASYGEKTLLEEITLTLSNASLYWIYIRLSPSRAWTVTKLATSHYKITRSLPLVLYATWGSWSPSSGTIREDSEGASIVWDTVVIDGVTYTFTPESWKTIRARQTPWWQYVDGQKASYVVNWVAL